MAFDTTSEQRVSAGLLGSIAIVLSIVLLTLPKYPMPAPPQWLRRWRALLIHLNLFIDQVTMMARLYSSTAIKANLRDRILTTHVLQGPASVMLTSYAAGVMKKEITPGASGTTGQEVCR